MLAKLFKYEIKATARLFLPLYLTILVFAVINRFMLPLYTMKEVSTVSNLAMTISMIIYITLMVGLMLMTLVVMIQRFYKNLLGDEGYLMFTLPVQSWKHIVSKLTASTLWTIASSIIALCSILVIFSRDIFTQEFYQQIASLVTELTQRFGASGYLLGFEVTVLSMLSLASTILAIYAAIALGHLFNKYKLLASFGMYIVLRTASQVFMLLYVMLFMGKFTLGEQVNSISDFAMVNSVLLILILGFAVITAGYFLLTNYILKRKLNLE